jgi:uncharacterized protein YdhG (YjbR/CyaY superfamily)
MITIRIIGNNDFDEPQHKRLLKGEFMDVNKPAFKTTDEYIKQFSPEVQELLTKVRNVIKEAVPEATEKISYQMPTFYLHENLVHFAVNKHHIGLYPTPSGVEAFKDQLTSYKTSKAAIQFPIEQPLPFELISEIAKYRASESRAKAEAKKKK